MATNHCLIYKDYNSLNELLSEPSGCAQMIYNALLKDIVAIAKNESTALEIFNEALWICTRVLIDPNPELHFKQYFPGEYEPKTFSFVRQRIIKAIVYGTLSLRRSNDFCLQQFLNLFDAGSKDAAPSMKKVYKLLESMFFYGKRRMELRPYVDQLNKFEECLTDKGVIYREEIYSWMDYVPDMLSEFDIFYTQQILSLLPKDRQKVVITKLYELFLENRKGIEAGTISGVNASEQWPDFCRQISSWHYDFTSVHGMGLNIPPHKAYEEDTDDTSSNSFTGTTPPQVAYDMDKAMDYYEAKEKDFQDNHLPLIKHRLERWWKRIPKEKQEAAIKEKQSYFYDQLLKSDFCKYSEAEVDYEYISDMASCADNGYQAQQWVDQEVFACTIADFYQHDIDVLDIDKIERYIWVNQKRLTDEQIFAFFAYDAMLTYLPDLMRKSSAEAFVQEVANTLKEDGVQKAALAKGKGIVEQEIDGNTDFFIIETFEGGEQENASVTISFKFIPQLRESKLAKEKLKQVLDKLNPKINTRGGKRSEKWQWPHVCDALKELELIDDDTTPTDFGTAINGLLSDRSAQSVSQSFKTGRINPDYPTTTDKSIIAEIVKIFQPVKDIINPNNQG